MRGPRCRRGAHWLAGLALAGIAAVAAVPAATAQERLDISLRDIEFTDDGETRVVVDVRGEDLGDLDAGAFTITEDGEPIDGLRLESVTDAPQPEPRTVMLAMDTSDSTAGEPRERSIAAAKAFARTVTERGVEVGVVSFAATAQLVRTPTAITGEVEASLDAMEGGFGTALYDGVVLAARSLDGVDGLQRSIIVFSDGADVGSTATLEEAATAAAFARASVTSVFLDTVQVDEEALEELADRTGGQVLQVDGIGGLDAAFARVADDLDNQYVLSYPSTAATGQFEMQVTATAAGASGTLQFDVLKPTDRGVVPRPPPMVRSVPAVGLLGESAVGPVAVGMAGIGLALLLLALLVPVSDRQVLRNLRAAVGAGEVDAGGREELSPTTAAMSRGAIQLVERIPKPEGYDAALQQRIDRAAWPLRSTEFTVLRLIAVVVPFGLLWSLSSFVLGALGAAVGWVVPNVVLSLRVSARQEKFMEQLPDTLQLLAGSMRAGYGVLQAIDTVVKESAEPTRSEFTRVLSETRLGLELDDSLMDMADRIGADDFRWVAVSISIQRRVGGNLAQLLETVAATLRERAGTRRQIQALSAEGRLSGVILTALPFALGGYMLLVNPDYLAILWTRGIGQAMIAGAAVLMVIGVIWMRRLIEIDV